MKCSEAFASTGSKESRLAPDPLMRKRTGYNSLLGGLGN